MRMRWPSTMGNRIAWADPDAGGGAPWIAVNATRNESTPRLTARPLHRARRPWARGTNVKHQFPSSTGALRAGIPDARQFGGLRKCIEKGSGIPFGQCHLVLAGAPIAFDGLLNCSQQILLVERLGQKLDRAGFHRLHGSRDIAMAVRNTMGVSNPASAIRFCRSSPLRPGSCRSNTTQLGGSIRAWRGIPARRRRSPPSIPLTGSGAPDYAGPKGRRQRSRLGHQTPAVPAYDRSSSYFGRLKWKIVPGPSLAVAHNRPP